MAEQDETTPNPQDRTAQERLANPIPEELHDPTIIPPGSPTHTPFGAPWKYDRWGRPYRKTPSPPPTQWATPSGQWEGPTFTDKARPSLEVFTTRNKKGEFICGSQVPGKPRGHYCECPDIAKNGRCAMHGGNSLAGVESHEFRGRGYSRYLPKLDAEIYEDLLTDPELLSSNHEIALLNIQIGKLVKGLEEGVGSVQIYQALKRQVRELNEAIGLLPTELRSAFRNTSQALSDIASQGQGDAELRTSLLTHLEVLRKHSDSQIDRQLKSKLSVDMRQMEAYAMNMVAAIMEEVEDSTLRTRIGIRLMNMRKHSTPTHGELGYGVTPPNVNPRPVTMDLPYAPPVEDIR